MKKNIKLIIFLSIQLTIVLAICLVILFDGKKHYTVTFDANGGTYMSGEMVQSVRYGESAKTPIIVKEGCVFVRWDGEYKNIKKDSTVTAIWEYETTYGIEFEILGNYCLVSGSFDNLSGNIYIGSMYQGKKVLGIKAGAFKNLKNIKSVYIDEGLVSIDDEAFSGCSSLVNVSIPSTVEVIGNKVFSGCTSLESLYVPFIGNSIHSNTYPFLGYLYGATDYTNAYRYVPKSLKKITLNSSYEIPQFAFYKCKNLENIAIAANIETIGDNAFRNCSGLQTINLSNFIKNIGKAAFANCTGLKEITLPDRVEELKEGVFANNTALEKIVIKSNLKNIANSAFQNCSKLVNFEIQNNSNFVCENNKLYIVKDNVKTEYVIALEKYTDETDSLVEKFPPFIIIPEKYPELELDESSKELDSQEKEKKLDLDE